MADKSKIEWTEHTFNPWWGCAKVSPGCKHCYAEGMSNRHTGRLFGLDNIWGIHSPRGFFGDDHWNKPIEWNRKAARSGRRDRVFCASMADLFESHQDPQIAWKMMQARERLYEIIQETPNLMWLLLTKRPENILLMSPGRWEEHGWPSNVCVMTSVEDQQRADERIPHLLGVPAIYHGLSVEPMLEGIRLTDWLEEFIQCYSCKTILRKSEWGRIGALKYVCPKCHELAVFGDQLRQIDWVIVGGESGHKARFMAPEWAVSIRDQCQESGASFFFKQWGTFQRMDGKKAAGRLLDGREWNDHPFCLEAEVNQYA